eukprot:CAMPEP_0168746176 /NCGR_PEP_ID=MMETSP0724-20121128/15009_1 /TAXON_ID=265536 /ORGANISM="Amphiprora sp., Strain CCMP467" /LENGTH=428 /DNA_ID=CAMNT_0008793933 /DNA_START=51 /DNA_END=1337 /DNA_ORIENTATION=-
MKDMLSSQSFKMVTSNSNVYVVQLLQGALILVLILLAASFVLPFVLAGWTWLRRSKNPPTNETDDDESCLLVGRVSHTRLAPKRHAFQYPIFMFALDLEPSKHQQQQPQERQQEPKQNCSSRFDQALWPLSLIVSFRPDQDHFLQDQQQQETKTSESTPPPLLYDKVCQLVSERTQGQLKPNASTHKVFLVTHLSYYGYCFNPVSFYYVVRKPNTTDDNKNNNTATVPLVDAIVAEVSNTPWLEMYPYVLHPASTDQVQVRTKQNNQLINYVFPKRFHVSPFMEMSYNYDWVFDAEWNPTKSLYVTTAMKRESDNAMQFTATLRVRATTSTTTAGTFPQDGLINPFHIAWQLARYPFYCVLLQIWIHYEAFWLFVKGVAYQPHPQGAETTASRLIGNLMTPLFALQDYWTAMTAGNRSSSQTQDKKAQ